MRTSLFYPKDKTKENVQNVNFFCLAYPVRSNTFLLLSGYTEFKKKFQELLTGLMRTVTIFNIKNDVASVATCTTQLILGRIN